MKNINLIKSIIFTCLHNLEEKVKENFLKVKDIKIFNSVNQRPQKLSARSSNGTHVSASNGTHVSASNGTHVI